MTQKPLHKSVAIIQKHHVCFVISCYSIVLFKEFKGALTEQYVLQQLKTLRDIEPYYWTNERNTAEIDFLLNTGNAVLPLEVKAEVNLQSKSLRAFADKFHPPVSVRSAMTDYKQEDWLLNLPLYAIGNISSCFI